MHFGDVVVHKRVNMRHPDISDKDVVYAWMHDVKSRRRPKTEPTQYAAVGFDPRGRLLEMCAIYNEGQSVFVVYHAMEATPKMLRELGLDH